MPPIIHDLKMHRKVTPKNADFAVFTVCMIHAKLYNISNQLIHGKCIKNHDFIVSVYVPCYNASYSKSCVTMNGNRCASDRNLSHSVRKQIAFRFKPSGGDQKQYRIGTANNRRLR